MNIETSLGVFAIQDQSKFILTHPWEDQLSDTIKTYSPTYIHTYILKKYTFPSNKNNAIMADSFIVNLKIYLGVEKIPS